jgi:hypothetical protein
VKDAVESLSKTLKNIIDAKLMEDPKECGKT